MTTQRLYLSSHPPFLTPQPLYLCHHTNSKHICIDVALYHDITTSVYVITLGTRMTSHPIYITTHSHFITSMIMFYDITNTAFMTSDLLYMTSHPLFRISHHFMYDIKSTLSDLMSTVSVSSHPPTSQPLYGWNHIQYFCDIISPVLRT